MSSGTGAADSYLAVLERPHARRLFGALCAAWLSYGVAGLALFLVVHRATGSSGLAGVAVAAFSLGSAPSAPIRGRVLDRRGVRPWLPIFTLGYATALVLLALFARVDPHAWLLILCAGIAGVSTPPLIAVLRNLWSSTVEETLLRRAYALTALVGDVGLAAPPALAGLLFVLQPSSPLLLAAAAALGATLVAVSLAPRGDASAAIAIHSERPSLFADRSMRAVLGVSIVLGATFGLVDVAVPAAATRWHAAGYSGLLLAAFSLGSIAGGLWYGRRRWQRPPAERYLLAVLVLAVALVPPLFATGATTLAPLLIVAGVGSGPATISLFEVLDSVAPTRGTEALTWITSAEATGVSAGAAVAGWATARFGVWVPFASGSAMLAVAAATALAFLHAGGTSPASEIGSS